MILGALGLVLAWVLTSCWRVARPHAATPPSAGPRPEAVFADSAAAALRDRHDSAPGDVAVVVRHPHVALPAHAVERLVAELADPEVGAVQPAIRASHTETLLGRLQDMEWVGLAELHSRRGQALGSLGIGDAGPAYRLSALRELDHCPVGPAADVRIAAELAARGWRYVFAPSAHVLRSPASSLRALIGQRIESSIGLLHSLAVVPRLARAGRWRAASALLAPIGLLVVGALVVVAAIAASADPDAAARVLIGPAGSHALVWYAVLFAPAWVAGFTYWTRHEDIGLAHAFALGHVFSLYSLLWVLTTWIALLSAPFHRTDAIEAGRVATDRSGT